MDNIDARLAALEDTLRELEDDVFEHKVSSAIAFSLMLVFLAFKLL